MRKRGVYFEGFVMLSDGCAAPVRDVLERARSPVENAEHMVLVAPSGNCFLQNDNNGIMDQHLGKAPFPASVVAGWKSILAMRAASCAELGVEYLYLLAADKQSVFWDEIGGGLPDCRNSLSIFDGTIPRLAVLDTVPVLAEAARSMQVFPRTDTHWDARGAYVAYRALLGCLTQTGIPPLTEAEDIEFFDVESPGDLGNKFSERRTSPNTRVRFRRRQSRQIFNNGCGATGGLSLFRRPGLDSIGILFGDSFSVALAPYMAEHFGYFIHARSQHLDLPMLRALRPTSVVSELTERFLAVLPPLADEDPIELHAIRKMVAGQRQGSDDIFRRIHVPAKTPEQLPAPLRDMVLRQEALVRTLLEPEAPPSDAQQRFLGPRFDAAGVADVIVAKYVARHFALPPGEGWEAGFAALPAATRSRFERVLAQPSPLPG